MGCQKNSWLLADGIDIVGDVHGCSWELRRLVEHLDYHEQSDGSWLHPEGRRLAFLGDLIDRGPDSVGALDLVERLIDSGVAYLAAVGNHDYEIYHGLIKGKPTWISAMPRPSAKSALSNRLHSRFGYAKETAQRTHFGHCPLRRSLQPGHGQ